MDDSISRYNFDLVRDATGKPVTRVDRRYAPDIKFLYFDSPYVNGHYEAPLASDTPFPLQRSNNFLVYSDGINLLCVRRVIPVHFLDYGTDEILCYDVESWVYQDVDGTAGTLAAFDEARQRYIAEGTWRGK